MLFSVVDTGAGVSVVDAGVSMVDTGVAGAGARGGHRRRTYSDQLRIA